MLQVRLILAIILICFLGCFAASAVDLRKINQISQTNQINQGITALDEARLVLTETELPQIPPRPLNEVKEMLQKQGIAMSPEVIDKVLTTLKCAQESHVDQNHILTVIDYSLPSNAKRLWVFDLVENKLLFHTYVSHGLKSGALFSNYFSNNFNSKASSIGVYNTENSYRGRHGPSLKLHGLDKNFNDRAYSRFVVMHGAWYVDENFIKKYGRAGRSWGCPAIPRNLINSVIDTIKDKSLFVMYYPSHSWFLKSNFLNCDRQAFTPQVIENSEMEMHHAAQGDEVRTDIVFADLNNNHQREESEPVLVMTADDYLRVFSTPPPLTRMLRRQINHTEYIVLNTAEVQTLGNNNDKMLGITELNNVYFVVAQVRMSRGYYATEMKILNLGKIKKITLQSSSPWHSNYVVQFENRAPLNLKSTDRFIRWLGL